MNGEEDRYYPEPQEIVYTQPTPQETERQCSTTLPPVQWIRHLTDAERDNVNTIIQAAEQITAKLLEAYNTRASLRDAIALLVCPFKVKEIVELGDGKAPQDRRVITAIVGGCTEKGEFWRAKSRVLTKGMKIGTRSMWLKPSEKGYKIIGVYDKVEGLPVEGLEEVKVI